MSARAVDHISIDQNALPVCLGYENPNRLVSLLDLVNEFKAVLLFSAYRRLKQLEGILDREIEQKGGGYVAEVRNRETRQCLDEMALRCADARFTLSADTAAIKSDELKHRGNVDCSTLMAEIRHVEDTLERDLFFRKFLTVREEHAKLIDQPILFGKEVNDAFPSAQRDITESGNCLAAGCGTAAVFHLMRAAEIALRVLAKDRGVVYSDGSLDTKVMGDLLSALDSKLSDLRKADAKLWPSKDVKDAQIHFYHSAIVEFRDFNEAWRKYMAHARVDAFYDVDYATSVMKHVKTLMQTLAKKVSEASATPLHWTSV